MNITRGEISLSALLARNDTNKKFKEILSRLLKKESFKKIISIIEKKLKPISDIIKEPNHFVKAVLNNLEELTGEERRQLSNFETQLNQHDSVIGRYRFTLATEFKFPFEFHEALFSYLIYGYLPKNINFGASLGINKNWGSVDIHIYPSASKRDTLKLVEKEWKIIKEILNKMPKEYLITNKIRTSKEHELKEKIYNLYLCGKTDKQISNVLKMGGNLSKIRKIISNERKFRE